jgi:release factor glutamine methyltransferase
VRLESRLAAAGFVAAAEEAAELETAAGGDAERLEALVARRLTGEPLAWITGATDFCELRIRVDPGVYVPRPQTEVLAERAAALLPDDGIAIDVCCGSGAIATVLRARRPGARVLAADVDPAAVACARANGVDAYAGDLFAALPPVAADVVVSVPPFVPTDELALLQRDTLTFESPLAYDGGADGLDLARRIAAEAPLRAGGVLVLACGADQVPALRELLGTVEVLADEDGDVRGVISPRRA